MQVHFYTVVGCITSFWTDFILFYHGILSENINTKCTCVVHLWQRRQWIVSFVQWLERFSTWLWPWPLSSSHSGPDFFPYAKCMFVWRLREVHMDCNRTFWTLSDKTGFFMWQVRIRGFLQYYQQQTNGSPWNKIYCHAVPNLHN